MSSLSLGSVPREIIVRAWSALWPREEEARPLWHTLRLFDLQSGAHCEVGAVLPGCPPGEGGVSRTITAEALAPWFALHAPEHLQEEEDESEEGEEDESEELELFARAMREELEREREIESRLPPMRWIVSHSSWAGCSLPSQSFECEEDARRYLARKLRGARRQGCPCAKLSPSSWEIGEPEDATMVPPICGSFALRTNQSERDKLRERMEGFR